MYLPTSQLNPIPALKSSPKFMGLREKLDKFQEKFIRGFPGQIVAAIQPASVSIISPFCTIFQGVEATLDHTAPARSNSIGSVILHRIAASSAGKGGPFPP